MTLAEFFHMGGYGFYVWMAYGVAAVVLLLNIIIPNRRHREIITGIRRNQRCLA